MPNWKTKTGLRGWNISWTAPRTAVTGEIYTAAILNTDVRDNLRYLKGMDGTVQIQDGLELTGTGTASYLKPPVLTTTQRDAIASPANGMIIFNSTDTKLQKYEGTWRSDMAYGGTLTNLAVPSMAIGDVFYADTATSIARVAGGTSGYFLRTQGTAGAPSWQAAGDSYYFAGTTILLANDTEGSASIGTTFTKVRESRIGLGTFTISADWKVISGITLSGTIYKNGTALPFGTISTTSTAYVTYSYNIGTWAMADLCQLYLRNESGTTGTAGYRNFRISGTGESVFKAIS